MDYLSMIDIESDEEQTIDIALPEDAENFIPCGFSPDNTQMIYLSTGGRIKQGGRIMLSGRFAMMVPFTTEGTSEFSRMTTFESAAESCPLWLTAK